MIILDLELTHFGKFMDKRIEFKAGLNVVYGKNEAGKSTVHAFIRGMLFGLDKQRVKGVRSNDYDHYEPWDDDGIYGGKMRIQAGSTIYRLERSFLRSAPYFRLIDEIHGRELEPAQEYLSEILYGLNESDFMNTISVEQMKSATDASLMEELQRFISNTSGSMSTQVNLDTAASELQLQKLKFESRVLTNAEGEYEESSRKLGLRRESLSELRQALMSNVQKQREAEELLEAEKKAYEAHHAEIQEKKESLRSRYEDARVLFAGSQIVEKDDLKKKNMMSWFMAALVLIFAGTCYYMLFMQEDSNTLSYTMAGVFGGLAGLMLVFALVYAKWFKGMKELLKSKYKAGQDAKHLVEQYEAEYKAFVESHSNPLSPEGIRLTEMLNQLQTEGERLSWEIEKSEEEEQQIYAHMEKLSAVLKENVRLREEADAIVLAIHTIQDVSGRVHVTFGNRLNEEAGILLGQITEGKYTSLVVTQEMGIALYTEDRLVPLKQLSRGTIEQIYLAIRIAAAKLLWQKEAIPFILDDIFAYYDDDRLQKTMDFLQQVGRQVIIFSCQTREEQYLKK